MQFIKPGINIDFIGKRKAAFFLSVAMILASVLSLVAKGGPRYGIDFAGGLVVQIKFDAQTDIGKIRKESEAVGLGNVTVQNFGEAGDNEYLIRSDIKETGGDSEKSDESKVLIEHLTKSLEAKTGGKVEVRRVEMVGPQVGADLKEQALYAMFFALLFITIYISGRFELKWGTSLIMAGALVGALLLIDWISGIAGTKASTPLLIAAALLVTIILFWVLELKYAMGAIIALVHDVTITVGIFSIFDKEFSLPIIAALLTIIGYSLNDTIIVFDRIRENLRKFARETLPININKSINETLSRTILTSITTLMVVVTLFVLGGGIIHDFAFALIVGVLIGTYSSVFVASPILIAWEEFGKRK